MSDDFTDQFWTWYATDEYRLVLDTLGLMKALDFLQSPATVQSVRIPYCPACETWSMMMLPVNDYLESLPADCPSVRQGLSVVWRLCNEIPADAFRCDDAQMYHAPAWEPLRAAAAEALQRMDWESLQPHIDSVTLECHQKLFPGTKYEMERSRLR